MSLYEIIGTIVGCLFLGGFVGATFFFAYKESKKNDQRINVQIVLMDKIYRILCNEYPENEVSGDE